MTRSWLMGAALALMLTSPVHGQEDQVVSNIPDAILGTAPPPQGIEARYVPGDEETQGYIAVPEGEGPFPAVILIHEWNGLTDRVRQVADALADQGYVALAADLYRGRTGSNRDENMALVQEARGNMDAVIANLDAAQQFLRNRPDVTGKIGVMGWCFGGGTSSTARSWRTRTCSGHCTTQCTAHSPRTTAGSPPSRWNDSLLHSTRSASRTTSTSTTTSDTASGCAWRKTRTRDWSRRRTRGTGCSNS